MLLTRSRLGPGPKSGSSLHLHVLGTPPAFVLSQDQTLREELHKESSGIRRSPETAATMWQAGGIGIPGPSLVGSDPCALARGRVAGAVSTGLSLKRSAPDGPQYTSGAAEHKTGSILAPSPPHGLREESSPRDGVEPGHTISIEVRSMSVHAVEFSKTAAPPREDCPLRSAPRPDRPILGQTAEYSARIRRRRLDFDLEAGPAPGGRSAVDQHRRSTSTVRSRGRSSKSNSTICCQVPSPRRPPITGIDTDGPITAARRCACALVS